MLSPEAAPARQQRLTARKSTGGKKRKILEVLGTREVARRSRGRKASRVVAPRRDDKRTDQDSEVSCECVVLFDKVCSSVESLLASSSCFLKAWWFIWKFVCCHGFCIFSVCH